MTDQPITILIAYDGSPLSDRAVGYAATVLRPGHVHIVTAYESVHKQAAKTTGAPGLACVDLSAAAGQTDTNLQAAKDTCARGAKLAEDKGLECTAHVVEVTTSTWTAIVDAARQLKPDVIVTGTRNQTGLKSWLTTSVSDNVVHNTGLPVLIVPEPKPL